MKVSIIGTGYVGLVSGVCFAEMGHDVTCIDSNQNKIDSLSDGLSPLYEVGLDGLLERNLRQERLFFSSEYSSVKDASCVFLAVGTPSGPDGQADLSFLFSALKSCLDFLSPQTLVVIKSTVPVGTCHKVEAFLKEHQKENEVVNNPEFLKEGTAVTDFLKPDRVIIGHRSEFARDQMEKLYAPLVRQGNPIYMMSNLSAELSKYACNAFLATKISFVNEMARLCDQLGANIDSVRDAMRSDPRIGKEFLYPGPGFGGSCFPKDLRSLIKTGQLLNDELLLASAAYEVNQRQMQRPFEMISDYFSKELKGKSFSLWGLAFKAKTDDVRESPALVVAKSLIKAGAHLKIYDPEASENFWSCLEGFEQDATIRCKDKYEALKGCDALVICTEWIEFQALNWDKLKEELNQPVIFDCRNLFSPELAESLGIEYRSIGRGKLESSYV